MPRSKDPGFNLSLTSSVISSYDDSTISEFYAGKTTRRGGGHSSSAQTRANGGHHRHKASSTEAMPPTVPSPPPAPDQFWADVDSDTELDKSYFRVPKDEDKNQYRRQYRVNMQPARHESRGDRPKGSRVLEECPIPFDTRSLPRHVSDHFPSPNGYVPSAAPSPSWLAERFSGVNLGYGRPAENSRRRQKSHDAKAGRRGRQREAEEPRMQGEEWIESLGPSFRSRMRRR